VQSQGTLFVLSAPSGTGKTTLAETLVTRVDRLELSRSYTSRPPRPSERDGVDYNFVRREQFVEMRRNGEFLEWADVFGHLYGTRRGDTEKWLAEGRDLVLVIDVQGASQVRVLGREAVGIFVLPPSPTVLEDRLRGRSGDHLPEPELLRRMSVARKEVERLAEYDYIVVNDKLDECVERLRCIVLAERSSQRVAGTTGETIAAAFRRPVTESTL